MYGEGGEGLGVEEGEVCRGRRKRQRQNHDITQHIRVVYFVSYDRVFMLNGLKFDLSFIHLSFNYKLPLCICRSMKGFREKIFFE